MLRCCASFASLALSVFFFRPVLFFSPCLECRVPRSGVRRLQLIPAALAWGAIALAVPMAKYHGGFSVATLSWDDPVRRLGHVRQLARENTLGELACTFELSCTCACMCVCVCVCVQVSLSQVPGLQLQMSGSASTRGMAQDGVVCVPLILLFFGQPCC